MAHFFSHSFIVLLLSLLLRWSLGGILFVAGVGKLSDRAGFVQAVVRYQILPMPLARLYAQSLPYVEVALALFLIAGLGTRIAALGAILLFVSFAIAIGVNLVRGKDLECHCFGKSHSEKIGLATLMRSILLALLAVQVTIFANRYMALDGWLFYSSSKWSFNEMAGVSLFLLVVIGLIILISSAQKTLTEFRMAHSIHSIPDDHEDIHD